MTSSLLPAVFRQWFRDRQWRLRPYQAQMLRAFREQRSTLLIAPTGGGKTLAGFLPALVDLAAGQHRGLHTLYVSPLKALTHDIERNLLKPVGELALPIKIESRTGDTAAHIRKRQRSKPPHILLTTPESLMLLLSYEDSPALFATLRLIVIDEIHSLAPEKRGDLLSLALARIQRFAPRAVRFGLSATVADPPQLGRWLGPAGEPAAVIEAALQSRPRVRILRTRQPVPLGGYLPQYALKHVYQLITEAKTTLVFVNTRAQAELAFQSLWDLNEQALPIALYHGSLAREQRLATEAMMAAGRLRAVIATAALELGIDWGDVDLVIQLGAPKGVSRLLQRIGRSNHRLDTPSRAVLVPSNRFEALECLCAINAIGRGELDGEPQHPGALDIIPQFIVNAAVGLPVHPDELYADIIAAVPYADLERATFDALLRFAVDGGYTLSHYSRHHRLAQLPDGSYVVLNEQVARRHRQNIGTIVENSRLRVKRITRKHSGRIVGEVEESFAQQLVAGDSFMFAGEVLEFEAIVDAIVEARPGRGRDPKIPIYSGGQLPLSTYLGEAVRKLCQDPSHWDRLPREVVAWLQLQAQFSSLPGGDELLIEQFPFRGLNYLVIYSFEGRRANQTLGMLLTKRMEGEGLQPISFSVTDYALAVANLQPMAEAEIAPLLGPDILEGELEEWLMGSPMLKRAFRRVATVSGLIEQNSAGRRKTSRQVTFSTDLIYDVLREYEPEHILLAASRREAERELLDLPRLAEWLRRFKGRLVVNTITKASPLSIPVMYTVQRERIQGEGIERLLLEAGLARDAEQMLDDVRHELHM